MSNNNKLAVVLIRGTINTHPDVRRTLELLRLKKKHALVVIDDNEVSRGMLQRVKDYTTYGTIDEKFFATIIEKRGELLGQIKVTSENTDAKKIAAEYFSGKLKLRDFEKTHNLKAYFRLAPPVGGFERGGIKMPFTKKGVLGQRGDKITALITKML